MKTRTLGRSHLGVSELGLGCMGMSWSYHPLPDRTEMTTLLRAAVDRGITFFDTAEVYGLFCTGFTVGETVPADHHRHQTCNLRDGAGE